MTRPTVLLISSVVFIASVSLASGGHGPVTHEQELSPSATYNGNTPTDLSHGLLFNNGTFGLANPSIEEWAKIPVVFPGISEKSYEYDSKAQRKGLIREANYQVSWGRAAIMNYGAVSADTRPEAVAHAKHAIEVIEAAVNRLEDATDKLEGAGRGDWDTAQADVRRAIVNFRLAYTQMHKNSRP